MYKFFILIMIMTFPYLSSAETIKGFVYGDSTNTPLAGVNISVLNEYTGTATDKNGYFILSNLKEHFKYKIEFNYIGYEDKLIYIKTPQDSLKELTIIMKPSPLRMRGIVVVANKQRNNVINYYRLNQESIKNLPAVVEPDVVRALAYIPGIIQYNDLKGDIVLRGSPPYQTQFLIDGMEIYYPWHMFGVFGVFNLDAIGDVLSYNAGFPAKYGGRSAGVIDISTPLFSQKREFKINLSLASVSAYYKQLHGKWGVMFSARKTYFDILSNFVSIIPFGFVDANLKLDYFISKTWNIELTTYNNNDFFSISPDQFTGDEPFSFGRFFKNFVRGVDNWGNFAVGLNLKYSKNNLFGQLRVYRTMYYMDFPEFINNRLIDYTINPEISINFNRETRLSVGLQYKNIYQNYHWGNAGNSEMEEIFPAIIYPMDLNSYNDFYTAYGDMDLKAGSFVFQPGIRITNYQNIFYHEERFGVRYFVSKKMQLYGHFGSYYQFSYAPFQNMEFTIGAPLLFIDKPSLTNHFSIGIKKQLNPILTTSIDIYYKTIADLPENMGDFRYDVASNNASISGIDIFLSKGKGYLTWQLAYSFLKSEAEKNGYKYPLDWDISHNLSFLTGIMISKGWFFNMGFFVHSGLPYTPVTGSYYGVKENSGYYGKRLIYGDYNSERLPLYMRFDFAVRKLYRFQNFDMFFKVQFFNTFYRDNVVRINWEEYYWNVSNNGGTGVDNNGVILGAPIIPSVGLEFIFK